MVRHFAIFIVGLAAVSGLNAAGIQIQIGGTDGLTTSYMTSGVGSIGTSTLSNYDANLFLGATESGTPPVPFTGYSNTAGTASTPGSTLVSSTGITFDMISQTSNDGNFWDLVGSTPTVVIPVGVFDVTQAWTMINSVAGDNTAADTQITYTFGTTATGGTETTVILDFVEGDEIQNAVECASSGTCTSLLQTGLVSPTMGVTNSGTGGVAAYNITSQNLYTGPYNTSAGSPYVNTTGNLVLDDQGIGFGNLYAGAYLVSIGITDLSSGNDGGMAVSAVTVVSSAPEPSSVFLFATGLGLLGLVGLRRNRRVRQN